MLHSDIDRSRFGLPEEEPKQWLKSCLGYAEEIVSLISLTEETLLLCVEGCCSESDNDNPQPPPSSSSFSRLSSKLSTLRPLNDEHVLSPFSETCNVNTKLYT